MWSINLWLSPASDEVLPIKHRTILFPFVWERSSLFGASYYSSYLRADSMTIFSRLWLCGYWPMRTDGFYEESSTWRCDMMVICPRLACIHLLAIYWPAATGQIGCHDAECCWGGLLMMHSTDWRGDDLRRSVSALAEFTTTRLASGVVGTQRARFTESASTIVFRCRRYWCAGALLLLYWRSYCGRWMTIIVAVSSNWLIGEAALYMVQLARRKFMGDVFTLGTPAWSAIQKNILRMSETFVTEWLYRFAVLYCYYKLSYRPRRRIGGRIWLSDDYIWKLWHITNVLRAYATVVRLMIIFALLGWFADATMLGVVSCADIVPCCIDIFE